MPYYDGAKKIFLYTKGTEGNPSQAIKDMLKYIQESTENNVTNEDIASVQKLVDKVKRKKEVGINYMKSWEYEKMIEDEAREAGYNEGFNNGTNNGAEKMSRLIILLTDADRVEDIAKAAHDADYREQLFKEFDL